MRTMIKYLILLLLFGCSISRDNVKIFCRDGNAKVCLEDAMERKDIDVKIEFAVKGCQLNNDDSCDYAGELYLNEQKKDLAKKYLTKGCNSKNGGSCATLGLVYKDENTKTAKNYYKMGCGFASGKGCFYYGSLFLDEKRHKEALGFMLKGCKLKHGGSCQVVARINGEIFRNYELAMKAAKRGCDANDSGSCYFAAMISQKTNMGIELDRYAKRYCELKLGTSICSDTDYEKVLILLEKSAGKLK